MDFLKYQTQNKDASFSSANPVSVSVVHVVKGVTVTQSNKMSEYKKASKTLTPVNCPTGDSDELGFLKKQKQISNSFWQD